MLKAFLTIIVTSTLSITAQGQLTATEIIDKSIKYHDPYGLLAKEQFTLKLLETRPNGTDRKTKVYIDKGKQIYSVTSFRGVQKVTMQKEAGKPCFAIDGETELSQEQIEKYRLNPDRLEFMVNYYRYLWMSPLILKDPGSHVNSEVKETDFFGKKSLEIKVTYDPEVGEDIWYFYFDPGTYALVGYRFYHDESANDGEYILFSDELDSERIRLPKTRKWYTHNEDKYLGEDTLESISIH